MARFTVIYNEPIWETTIFRVEVPDPLPGGHQTPVEYIRENLHELMAEELDSEDTEVVQGDRIASMDSDIEIRDADGNVVYTDLSQRDGEAGDE